MTFIDFYCLINTRFWITNEKKFIKKITFSDVYFFISHFISHKLCTKNKSKNIQKSKKSKKSKVIFSDFYCLINTKFWITNEKMFIKKNHF